VFAIAALTYWLITKQQPSVTADEIFPRRRHHDDGYERSIPPTFVSGLTRFRDIVPVTPPDALSFYQPRMQQFMARHDASIRFDMPGSPGEFVRVGFVYSNTNESLRLPLFGRPIYPGGNRFEYYVLDDTRHKNPIELKNHNGLELETDNTVSIAGFADQFTVHIY
jgi:hypothetical protein